MLLNNRYQILKSFGSGGFGETFIAEDTQMPSKRQCLIKRLHPVSSDDQKTHQLIRDRFHREAAILEDLGNGNDQIPSLYAYFEQDSKFYLVQELIQGKTLSILLQEVGNFSEAYVKEFLTDLLPVIDYIHSRRIVHRDINPDNIIIRTCDNKPVLIDFGAVKESMGTTMTISGNVTGSIVIGTPGFMPSEQAAGRPVYSSDLYAIGLTAIYMLTGKLPQILETDYKTGEVLWRQHAPRVGPTLASILDKAIHSHAQKRYATAREMLQALQPKTVQRTLTSSQTHTLVVSPHNYQLKKIQQEFSSKSRNWRKTLILGIFFAIVTVMFFWVVRSFNNSKPALNSDLKPKPSPESSTIESPTNLIPEPSQEPPDSINKDRELEEKLIGVWEKKLIKDSVLYELEEAFYPSKEFSGTAVLTNDSGDSLYIKYSGNWRIEDGYLYYKITSSNIPDLMPIGDINANRIVNITDQDYVYIDQDGKQQIDRRKS